MATNHTHPQDCPDRKAAAKDRAEYAAAAKARELRLQAQAHVVWFAEGLRLPAGR